jgi:hypothetical protein
MLNTGVNSCVYVVSKINVRQEMYPRNTVYAVKDPLRDAQLGKCI